MRYVKLGAVARALPFLLAAPGLAFAQVPQSPTQAEASAAVNPAPAVFSPAQLDQMLAPIALYPDQLLMEVLMAATFPQQVIDAGTWLQDTNNAALSGDPLVAALQPLPWDPSVKSLVAFPQIIVMMNNHPDWTEALGTAFAGQQVAVMARVQYLRLRAANAGRLASTKHLIVRRHEGYIVIEPENPAMIYVPVYNPAEVYGEWPDNNYPPVYLPPPPRFYVGEIGTGIGFSVGFGVAAPLWGWGHPDWRRHDVYVNTDRYRRITTVTNITRNNIVIRNNTWHRTAPIVRVPQAQRPHPAAAAAVTAPRPAGTVSSTALGRPQGGHGAERPAGPAAHPPAAALRPGEAHPPGTAPAVGAQHPAVAPHPAEVVRPGIAPHPAQVVRPGIAPHPAQVVRPGIAPHPAQVVRPGIAPHPAQVVRPGIAPHPAAAPRPAEQVHRPAAAPRPAEQVHRPAAAPRPAAVQHPAPPPRPAAVQHPAPPPRPAAVSHPAPPPRPAAVQHPAPPPRPSVAPHPAPPPRPAAVQHPAPPPHPAAAAHGPAKKAPPKPGEEDRNKH
ncbi:MAG TPA: DUF3300 domain-containing protein [Stellaceae bacterium]|nr:DUF3300 domain-containing protein [Stellaceae bacterium]